MITVSVLLVAVLNNLHAILLHRVGFSYGTLENHQRPTLVDLDQAEGITRLVGGGG